MGSNATAESRALSPIADDSKLQATPLHTHQLQQEDIAGQVTELMQQNTSRDQPMPAHQQQILLNPFFGSLHVNEQEQIDHLLHSEGGRRFRTAAITGPSPSPHDAVLLNELAHLQRQQQSMVGNVAEATTSVAAQSQSDVSEDDGCD